MKVSHPPISHMLWNDYAQNAKKEAEGKKNEQKVAEDSIIPKVFRPYS